MADPAPAMASLERHPDDGWVRAEPWPMGRATQRALNGMCVALCPPAAEGAPTTPELLADVAMQVRRMLPYMHPLSARGVVLIIWLLEWSPIWRLRGLRRLHTLSHEQAAAQLDAIAASRWFGKLALAARATVLTSYFDQPAVQAAIGYAPVPFMAERIAARRQLLAGDSAVALLSPSEADLLSGRDSALAARGAVAKAGALRQTPRQPAETTGRREKP